MSYGRSSSSSSSSEWLAQATNTPRGPELPEGWVQYEQDGYPYYYHNATGKSVWASECNPGALNKWLRKQQQQEEEAARTVSTPPPAVVVVAKTRSQYSTTPGYDASPAAMASPAWQASPAKYPAAAQAMRTSVPQAAWQEQPPQSASYSVGDVVSDSAAFGSAVQPEAVYEELPSSRSSASSVPDTTLRWLQDQVQALQRQLEESKTEAYSRAFALRKQEMQDLEDRVEARLQRASNQHLSDMRVMYEERQADLTRQLQDFASKQESHAKAMNELNHAIAQLTGQKASLEALLTRAQQDVEQSQKLLSKLEFEKHQKEQELAETRAESARTVQHLQLELDRMAAAQKTLEASFETAQVDAASAIRSQHESELSQLKKQLAEVNGLLETEQARYQALLAERQHEAQQVAEQVVARSASAASDRDGQLTSLQQQIDADAKVMARLKEQLAVTERNLIEVRAEKASLSAQLEELRAQKDAAIEQTKAKYKGQVEKLKAALQQMDLDRVAAVEAAEAACHAAAAEQLRAATEAAVAEVTAVTEHKVAEAVSKTEVIWQRKLQEIQAANEEQNRIRMAAAVADAEAKLRESMETLVSAAEADKRAAIAAWQKEAALRKETHNRLLELQGNIRVMCRVRPVLPVEERSGDCATAVKFPSDTELEVQPDSRTGRTQNFEFDRVFQPGSTQVEVFEQVKGLVTSVMDGYHVCIFAYGQTGSGKTHTMEGEPDNPGVNLRALQELFGVRDARAAVARYDISVSVLEIYNEAVKDLLTTTEKPSGLDLRMTAAGHILVEDLTQVTVNSPADVVSVMRTASKHRTVGGHDMNMRSSRSHLVLTVYVTRVSAEGTTESRLNLIDLAGSERISKTNAEGERLKEAQFINSSLLALGDVIAALGQKKKQHIPFRNSKLTFLLQDSLSSGSKVLMCVNVSPVHWNVSETICSLNFAQRCSAVQLGQAKKADAKPPPPSGSRK